MFTVVPRGSFERKWPSGVAPSPALECHVAFATALATRHDIHSHGVIAVAAASRARVDGAFGRAGVGRAWCTHAMGRAQVAHAGHLRGVVAAPFGASAARVCGRSEPTADAFAGHLQRRAIALGRSGCRIACCTTVTRPRIRAAARIESGAASASPCSSQGHRAHERSKSAFDAAAGAAARRIASGGAGTAADQRARAGQCPHRADFSSRAEPAGCTGSRGGEQSDRRSRAVRCPGGKSYGAGDQRVGRAGA